jgi:hypothetical protein
MSPLHFGKEADLMKTIKLALLFAAALVVSVSGCVTIP